MKWLIALLLCNVLIARTMTDHIVDGAHFSLSIPKEPSQGTIIIANGLHTGRRSLQLIGDPGPYTIIAYEYQEVIKEQSLLKCIQIRKALLRTPAELQTIAKWTLSQPWYTGPPIMMGVSFGAIFIPATYFNPPLPLGPSILAYGGADLYLLIKTNLPYPDFISRLIAKLLAPLEPQKYLPLLTGPTLIINGKNDKKIPAKSRQKLIALTPEPKTIISLETEHLSPKNVTLIRKLVTISRNWLETNP